MAEKPNHTQRVPGALASHYAPATPLELCPREYLPRRSLELELKGVNLGIVTWSAQCTEQLNHLEKKQHHALSHAACPRELWPPAIRDLAAAR